MNDAGEQTTRPTTTNSDLQAAEEAEFNFNITVGQPARIAAFGLKPNIFDGVTGMLRFGTDESPDLYFALGDLLALRGDKNLACRAYQRAI